MTKLKRFSKDRTMCRTSSIRTAAGIDKTNRLLGRLIILYDDGETKRTFHQRFLTKFSFFRIISISKSLRIFFWWFYNVIHFKCSSWYLDILIWSRICNWNALCTWSFLMFFFTIVFNCFIIFLNKYICEIGRVTWMLCVHNKSSITLSAVVVGLQN